MRGKLTYKILENASGFVGGVKDFAKAVLLSGYGASGRKIRKTFFDLRDERDYIKAELEMEKANLEKMISLIYKLKSDDCISVNSMKNSKLKWDLTKSGIKKLIKLQRQFARGFLPSPHYSKERSEQIIIVIFDIPESERRKRDWFRAVVEFLGFKMLQKSVWIGYIKISEDLMGDLKNLRLLDYIEIFSVNKAGSLKQLV